MQAHTAGVTLEYEEFGDSAAPLVVLIMGLGEQIGGMEFPADFCTRLAARGFRVVRFDNRDVGLSSDFDDRGTPDISGFFAAQAQGRIIAPAYTAADMADDVAGLLDHLAVDRAHIAGASLGRIIGRWFAARHPHRCASLTAIMTGHARTPGGPPLSAMDKSAAARMLTKTDPLDRDAAIDGYIAAWRSYNGSGFDFDEDHVRACAERSFDRAYHPVGVGRQVTAITPGLLKAEQRISAPTIVFHGDEDPLFGLDHPRLIVQNISGAELEIVRGMGHEMPPAVWPRLANAIQRAAARAG